MKLNFSIVYRHEEVTNLTIYVVAIFNFIIFR